VSHRFFAPNRLGANDPAAERRGADLPRGRGENLAARLLHAPALSEEASGAGTCACGMPELTQPPELTLTGIELTNAQLAEIWGADSEEDAVALLARIVKLPDAADEPRTAAWVDLMHQTLVFAKHVPLSGAKTLAFFALGRGCRGGRARRR